MENVFKLRLRRNECVALNSWYFLWKSGLTHQIDAANDLVTNLENERICSCCTEKRFSPSYEDLLRQFLGSIPDRKRKGDRL